MAVVFSVPQKIGEPTDKANAFEIIESIKSSAGLQILSKAESDVLTSIFGKSIKNSIYGEPSPDARPDGNGGYIATSKWGGYMSSSLAGMPVMCRLKFVGTTYLALDGTEVTIPDIIFETVLISTRQNKNIKTTNITGRRNSGSIKEMVGTGDWDIDIRAIITQSANVTTGKFGGNQDGVYPIENMDAIRLLIESDISLKVECWYLNRVIGVNYVIINTGVDISQVEGEYEMQRLVLPCLSDKPLILTIGR